MDQQTIIADMEARAQAAGISIRQLCQLADVHPTTFSRWKLSDGNPTPVSANLASLNKLGERLEAIERERAA
jgi:hypothetical protein